MCVCVWGGGGGTETLTDGRKRATDKQTQRQIKEEREGDEIQRPCDTDSCAAYSGKADWGEAKCVQHVDHTKTWLGSG